MIPWKLYQVSKVLNASLKYLANNLKIFRVKTNEMCINKSFIDGLLLFDD